MEDVITVYRAESNGISPELLKILNLASLSPEQQKAFWLAIDCAAKQAKQQVILALAAELDHKARSGFYAANT